MTVNAAPSAAGSLVMARGLLVTLRAVMRHCAACILGGAGVPSGQPQKETR